MSGPEKKFNTIGCCGIDCGLCPRYHTSGASRCPGCGAAGFHEKHPACGVLSCCAGRHGAEVCSDCGEYPCKRFETEKAGMDSFVTHQKMRCNLNQIREQGLGEFISRQGQRMEALKVLLEKADDGRSKGFYCLACALLPISELEDILAFVKENSEVLAIKDLNRETKERMEECAEKQHIQLKLRK